LPCSKNPSLAELEELPLCEGVGDFKSPDRLETEPRYREGGTYDTRVPLEVDGLTLVVQYGRRTCDWRNGKNHNLRWEPENRKLEKYRFAMDAQHGDLRYLLEARNNQSIYFHRINQSGSLLADEFQDGEVVQVECKPYRVYD